MKACRRLRLRLFEILVPASFSLKHHKEWDKKVLRITNGLTIVPQVIGKWRSETVNVNEKMLPVRIACKLNELKKILKITKEHYKQEEVFAYLISNSVYVV